MSDVYILTPLCIIRSLCHLFQTPAERVRAKLKLMLENTAGNVLLVMMKECVVLKKLFQHL